MDLLDLPQNRGSTSGNKTHLVFLFLAFRNPPCCRIISERSRVLLASTRVFLPVDRNYHQSLTRFKLHALIFRTSLIYQYQTLYVLLITLLYQQIRAACIALSTVWCFDSWCLRICKCLSSWTKKKSLMFTML